MASQGLIPLRSQIFLASLLFIIFSSMEPPGVPYPSRIENFKLSFSTEKFEIEEDEKSPPFVACTSRRGYAWKRLEIFSGSLLSIFSLSPFRMKVHGPPRSSVSLTTPTLLFIPPLTSESPTTAFRRAHPLQRSFRFRDFDALYSPSYNVLASGDPFSPPKVFFSRFQRQVTLRHIPDGDLQFRVFPHL